MEEHEHIAISAKGSAIILQNIIGGLSGLLTLFFISRYLPKNFYGMYAFVLSIYNLYIFLTDLGFSSAYIKRRFEKRFKEEELLGTYFLLKIIMTIIIVLGSLTLVRYVLPAFGYKLFDATTQTLFDIMLLWILFEGTLHSILNTFMASRMSYVTNNLIAIGEALTRSVLQIIVAIMYKNKMLTGFVAADLLLIAFIISRAIATALRFIFFRIHGLKLRPVFNIEIIKDMARFAVPLALSGAIAVLSTNIDKIMLGWIYTSADVADYNVVQRYAIFISNIALGLSGMFFVKVSRDVTEKTKEEIIDYLKSWEETFAILVGPAIPLSYILADNLIRIFLSNQYLTASQTFFVLVLTYVLVTIRSPVASVFGSFNKPWIGASIAIIANITNIILNAVFIPRMKSLGAALATLISIGILGSILLYALASRVLDLKGLGIKSHLYLLLGFSIAPIAYLLKPFLYRVFTFVPAVILMYLLYIFLMRYFKIISDEIFRRILGMVNLKNLITVFKQEINANEEE